MLKLGLSQNALQVQSHFSHSALGYSGRGERKVGLRSSGLELLGFYDENEQARLFLRVPAFSSARSPRHPVGVLQLKPASARDLGACLWYRTFWLDLYRISVASRALSPRSGFLANTRTAPSLPA